MKVAITRIAGLFRLNEEKMILIQFIKENQRSFKDAIYLLYNFASQINKNYKLFIIHNTIEMYLGYLNDMHHL